jgi:NitT/TauT family transport system ATP-binding protein
MSGGASVSIDRVTKGFRTSTKDVTALTDFSLDVEPGQFVVIVGPSGCGKSTLLRLVAGLSPVTQGRIVVDGQPVTGTMNSVGMVFQDDVLLKWRSVMGNLMLPVEIKDLDRKKSVVAAQRLLEQVGLTGFEHVRPAQLSGGMRQRVAICQALIQEPRLLLMDEPFGALDALTREQMQLDLQELWLSHRNTVLFITHSISEAAFLADRIIVMTPRPGRTAAELVVDMPRPRLIDSKNSEEYRRVTTKIHEIFQAEGVLKQ